MAGWVVSSHGGAVKKSKFGQLFAPTKKFQYRVTYVPKGIELIMFTAQGKIFYGGNPELDALIAGNEDNAVVTGRVHKIKSSYKIIPDYRAYGTNDFRSGIYIVGGGGQKAYDLPNGSVTKLSTIFSLASTAGVNRIYWLACTEF